MGGPTVGPFATFAGPGRARPVTQRGHFVTAAPRCVAAWGKPESPIFLSPNLAQITWKLVGQEEAYEHFGPPFCWRI